jgi:hypothetical protein
MSRQTDLTQVLRAYEDSQGLNRGFSWQKVEQGFTCKHCRSYVTTHMLFSGVQNRNHCPYCLWSRHLDLYQAGDRLAACKANMQPVGLTLKQSRKKYAFAGQGELMLIHLCTECGRTSINRLAADDDTGTLLEVYEESLASSRHFAGIHALGDTDRGIVQARLYGMV